MKIVFDQVKNKVWNMCFMGLALLPLHSNHPISLLSKSMGWFLCNGNTGMDGQSA